jgi:hypothetical protein
MAAPITPEAVRGEIDSPHAWLMAAMAFCNCFVVFGVA